jgi:uncharacterized membrane protein YoaK (UPF0700 family)
MEPASPNRARGPVSPRHHLSVLLLAMTSGSLDAVGFLGLGGVFASVMTGNLVLLGLGAGTRDGALAVRSALAIAAYALGVAVGARLAHVRAPTAGSTPTRRLHVAMGAEFALVLGFSIGWALARGRPTTSTQLALIATAALAMGVQGAVVRATTGGSLSSTYLTGTLTGVVEALVTGRPWRGELAGTTILASALAGAAAAGIVLATARSVAPLVPLTALAAALIAGRGAIVADPGPAMGPDGGHETG